MAPRRRSSKSMRRSKKSRSSSQKKSKKASPQKRRRSFRAVEDSKNELFKLLSLNPEQRDFLESFDDTNMIDEMVKLIKQVQTYVNTNKALNTKIDTFTQENLQLTAENAIIREKTKDDMKVQDEKLQQHKMLVNSLKVVLSSILGK